MKDFRFFLEYPEVKEKRKATVKNIGNHSGNCIALWLGREHIFESGGQIQQEAFVGVYSNPNSECCFGAVSWGYLRERCKRIPEKLAREIHPNLFKRIED